MHQRFRLAAIDLEALCQRLDIVSARSFTQLLHLRLDLDPLKQDRLVNAGWITASSDLLLLQVRASARLSAGKPSNEAVGAVRLRDTVGNDTDHDLVGTARRSP